MMSYFKTIIKRTMKKEVFKIRVQEIAYGWSRIFMLINDKEVCFTAGYMIYDSRAFGFLC